MFAESPHEVAASRNGLSPLGAAGACGWQAHLALDYIHRAGKTVLTRREHNGPLIVQKALYPEGDAVCHTIVVHPPGGIAGGDQLQLNITLGANAAALLTTPGATKWYRSSGLPASQRVDLHLGRGACLEWLPQETILFDAALGSAKVAVHLDAEATYIGWDILCLGRTASGERFLRGSFNVVNEIFRERRPLWIEQGQWLGADPLLTSPAGFNQMPVCATLVAAASEIAAAMLAACRAVQPADGAGAVTSLPGVLLARYLGPSTESARRYFIALWTVLRPTLTGRDARPPRIWST